MYSLMHVWFRSFSFSQLLPAVLLFGVIVFSSTRESHSAEYDLYSYHNVPPFVTGPNTGLSHDLVAYLNRHGEGRYSFKLTMVPRKRLDMLLKSNSDIIVPWTSPDWFGKEAKNRYAWTPSIISDGNIYISSKEHSIEVENVNSLQDLVLGGVLGHRYSGLDEEVAKGTFSRMNTINERTLIRMIAAGRVDVGIMAESVARYLVWEEGLADKIYFSANKHSVYVRRMLLSGYLPKVNTFLDDIILKMGTDPEWISIMSRYQLPPNS